MRLTKAEARELGIEPTKVFTPMPGKVSSSAFAGLCVAQGLPEPVAEFRFHPVRKWRFDFLFEPMVALEVDGAVWTNGRHTRGKGYIADMEKLNEAVLMGYTVLRATPQMVESGEAFALVKRALTARG